MFGLKILLLCFDLLLLPIIGLTIIGSLFYKHAIHFGQKGPDVIFLHGSGGNHFTLALGAWILSTYGFRTHIVQYDKLLIGTQNKGILNYANDLREFIKNSAEDQREVILVGHSMGGLIAAAYSKYYATLDGMRVKKIITLGTPWHGSHMIDYLKIVNTLSKRHHEMQIGSQMLEELRIFAQADSMYNVIICVGSHADIHVPYPSPILRRSPAITLYLASHWSMILRIDLWRKLAKMLLV